MTLQDGGFHDQDRYPLGIVRAESKEELIRKIQAAVADNHRVEVQDVTVRPLDWFFETTAIDHASVMVRGTFIFNERIEVCRTQEL